VLKAEAKRKWDEANALGFSRNGSQSVVEWRRSWCLVMDKVYLNCEQWVQIHGKVASDK
jgi:hypothetical protein